MHYQNIFILEIFAFCVVGLKFYQTGDEWIYRLTGLFTMLMMPAAALEYIICSGNIKEVKIYSLSYSIILIMVSVGLGVCTNLIAAINRVKTNYRTSNWLIVCTGIGISLVQIFFYGRCDIIRLQNGIYVYDRHYLGNIYIPNVFFGIILSTRCVFIAYKIYRQSILKWKKKIAKEFLILQAIFTVGLTSHYLLVLTGVHVPFGISLLILLECTCVLWHYRKNKLKDPRVNMNVIRALKDIFHNYIVLDKNFIIIDINTACKDMLELKYRDIVNKPIITFIQKEYLVNEHEIPLVLIQDCIENGIGIEINNKEQTLFFKISSIPCFSSNNRKTGYLLELIDLTLSKKNEQLFDATQQLKKQMLINEHFSNTISHDIKTPVIEIEKNILNAKLENMEQYQSLLLKVQNSLHQLKGYIDLSLDYSLHTNLSEKTTPIKSTQLFSQIKTLFNFILSEKNIAFIITGEVLLHQNKLLLEQVFINLINNTLKHNENHKKLIIEIVLQSRNDKNILLYSDNGKGIHPQKKAAIFIPSSSTLGLPANIGLPMCKKLVEMMDGVITETGVYGKGAKFIIELPILPIA